MHTLPARTIALLALACCCWTGCRTPAPGPELTPEQAAELARAEALYRQGSHTAAMIACVDLGRAHPELPGLAELQNNITAALAEQRERFIKLRADLTETRMLQDVDRHKAVPDTYGLRTGVRGETGIQRGLPTRMETSLRRKVTVHLDSVSLNDFILAIGASENINIIADDFEDERTMTLHAEDTPLNEILDYVSRNMGVSFSVGENIIWCTQSQEQAGGMPMEMRMYHLRKGLANEEIEGDNDTIGILDAIERFIDTAEGADAIFNTKAHILLVKNTRDNLARIEDIIETLDVCPPQVIIEARFLSTSVNDLSELGIDWILNSPVAVTKKDVLRYGQTETVTKTEVNNASLGFAPFANAVQGLNFTYQGLLTDPMFQAVLHALELSGKSRTLSVPRITTVNNRPATIRIGEDFRYFDEYDVVSIPSNVSDAGNTVYSSVVVPVGRPQLEELGIQLDVTPSVGADMRTVSLKLTPEISEFVRYESYEVSDGGGVNRGLLSTNGAASVTNNTAGTSLLRLPIFRRSKLETEVLVQSGETIVMGGLISSTESRSEKRVPFLSAIPLIGRFFRHDETEEIKQNLLIFVTATILSDRGIELVPVASR